MEVTNITKVITNKLNSSIHKGFYMFPLLYSHPQGASSYTRSFSNGILVPCILPFTAEQAIANAILSFGI